MSRVIVAVDDNGNVRTLVAHISTEDELQRLGLEKSKPVRVRQAPADVNPDVQRSGMEADGVREVPVGPNWHSEIPAELRGRLGTIVRAGGLYKYDHTARVRLHRLRPGEPRETLTLPLIWLESVEG